MKLVESPIQANRDGTVLVQRVIGGILFRQIINCRYHQKRPRIATGVKTSCNGLDIFHEFLVPREVVHEEKRLYMYINLYGFFKCKLCMAYSAEKFGVLEMYALKVTV